MKKDIRYSNSDLCKIKPALIPALFVLKNECCGCGLCCSVCKDSSVGAITMVKDEEGFEYPQIDLSLCVGCHKCLQKCPMKNNVNTKEERRGFK
jgi:ferredoxin